MRIIRTGKRWQNKGYGNSYFSPKSRDKKRPTNPNPTTEGKELTPEIIAEVRKKLGLPPPKESR